MNTAEKLENPWRLAELRPEWALKQIGLKPNQVLCDIGAGSGIFTLAAARITSGMVYALDIQQDMLNYIDQKAKAENLTNIQLIPVHGQTFDLPDATVDIILMVTVFHEIFDKSTFLAETHRILNKDGQVMLIEFHGSRTPMGPPPERRISKPDAKALFNTAGFNLIKDFDLGKNFYCNVFQKC